MGHATVFSWKFRFPASARRFLWGFVNKCFPGSGFAVVIEAISRLKAEIILGQLKNQSEITSLLTKREIKTLKLFDLDGEHSGKSTGHTARSQSCLNNCFSGRVMLLEDFLGVFRAGFKGIKVSRLLNSCERFMWHCCKAFWESVRRS